MQWCEKRAKNKWVGRRDGWSRERLEVPEEEGVREGKADDNKRPKEGQMQRESV